MVKGLSRSSLLLGGRGGSVVGSSGGHGWRGRPRGRLGGHGSSGGRRGRRLLLDFLAARADVGAIGHGESATVSANSRGEFRSRSELSPFIFRALSP